MGRLVFVSSKCDLTNRRAPLYLDEPSLDLFSRGIGDRPARDQIKAASVALYAYDLASARFLKSNNLDMAKVPYRDPVQAVNDPGPLGGTAGEPAVEEAVTVGVAFEFALDVPSAFDAITRERMRCPTSARRGGGGRRGRRWRR